MGGVPTPDPTSALHNGNMETFQIIVIPIAPMGLWEIVIVGVGVTQAQSLDDVQMMARDYLDCMGHDGAGARLEMIGDGTDELRLVQIQAYAAAIRHHYDVYNKARRDRTWTLSDYMLGFLGDVGTLARHVMAHEGHRDDPEGGIDMGHHLADCLWSIMTLAEISGTDLEAAFKTLVKRLEHNIANEITQALAEQNSAG